MTVLVPLQLLADFQGSESQWEKKYLELRTHCTAAEEEKDELVCQLRQEVQHVSQAYKVRRVQLGLVLSAVQPVCTFGCYGTHQCATRHATTPVHFLSLHLFPLDSSPFYTHTCTYVRMYTHTPY